MSKPERSLHPHVGPIHIEIQDQTYAMIEEGGDWGLVVAKCTLFETFTKSGQEGFRFEADVKKAVGVKVPSHFKTGHWSLGHDFTVGNWYILVVLAGPNPQQLLIVEWYPADNEKITVAESAEGLDALHHFMLSTLTNRQATEDAP